MRFKKILTVAVLSALLITTLIPSVPVYAATTNQIKASRVTAVALGCPFHFTVSLQGGKLVLSGNSPDYTAPQIKIDLIKQAYYKDLSTDTNGVVTVHTDRIIANNYGQNYYYLCGYDFSTYTLRTQDFVQYLNKNVVKTLTHSVNLIGGSMARTKPCPEGLTLDFPTAPQIDISDLSDGVYNLRTGFIGDPAYDYFYHDDILIVIHNGKASIQLLPTYPRYVTCAGGSGWYTGYSLNHWDVRPAITDEAFNLWLQGL